MSKNRLKGEASPYLLQHKDNPVHWWPWGKEALAAAKKQNKPVLLSVGYAACHWCHVMAHESFEDKETAELMNRLFINIKVDREERPDVDAIYQRAVAMMGQSGGWPLTVFLDPEGAPFWGGTYFPKEPQAGRPSFKTVLEKISTAYKDDPEAVSKNRVALAQGLKKAWQSHEQEDLKPSVYFGAAELVAQNMDPKAGGLKGAPKFPNIPLKSLLWGAGIRKNKNTYRLLFEKTLTMICQGGIYDHLGGGFCRYSTDPFWLVPHFEKMLYDNALILEALSEAHREKPNPLFAKRVEQTVDWLVREMKIKGGAFAAALDADSEGEEGKFYVWSVPEIEEVLGSKAQALINYYGAEPGGNWEGKNILHRLYEADNFDPEEDRKIEPLRKRLLKRRNTRERPFLDDKILADWNGLMIYSLVFAARTFDRPAWLKLAKEAFGFIEKNLQKKGRLYHSFRKGVLGPKALVDDYAALIRAATALYSATGTGAYLDRAEAWAAEAEKRLWDAKGGGFYLSGQQDPPLVTRPKTIFDQAMPSGNGLMISNYDSLYKFTAREAYREKAQLLLKVFAKPARTAPLAAGTFFTAFDQVCFGAHLFIRGKRSDPAVKKLLKAACSLSCPGLTLQVENKDCALPQARGLKPGQAVLCKAQSCSLPLEKADKLKEALYDIREVEES